MARNYRKPKLQTRWQVMQEYFRDCDDCLMTDGYPEVFATEADAQSCLERIKNADPCAWGGWLRPGASLYVTSILIEE